MSASSEAALWSIFYIAVAVGYGLWLTTAYGSSFGAQFFAGYIVEKSLSVDNLFVFVIIMATFAVPEMHQHKGLTFGMLFVCWTGLFTCRPAWRSSCLHRRQAHFALGTC